MRGQIQTPACDRCTVGVMDATNPHLLGTCPCECHDYPELCTYPDCVTYDEDEPCPCITGLPRQSA